MVISVLGDGFEIVTDIEEHAYCVQQLVMSTTRRPVDVRAPIPRRVQQAEAQNNVLQYESDGQQEAHVRKYSITVAKGHVASVFFKYGGMPLVGLERQQSRLPLQLPLALGDHSGRDGNTLQIRAVQKEDWAQRKVLFHVRETLLEILFLHIRPQPMIPSRILRVNLAQVCMLCADPRAPKGVVERSGVKMYVCVRVRACLRTCMCIL